ncbi:hypothetical protein [Amycolatopsis antarctica]|uniref:hypothetical protein n=1 Tax=Amycolatopsis antarctica TaxID=1854586 RepID=UPI0013FE0879|nr:hypothetical protein [Amycolatopsis antarctica]
MLRRKTWRWFTVRLTGLSPKSLTRLSLTADTGNTGGTAEASIEDLDAQLGIVRE